ncbi:DMT family transporter [Porcipelethomonas sp.]|uniref:DMT family transporter n=1 Tax=Porcipelethomonas sp. TaxID=2981675 RepID=UPI003EF3EF49
MENKTGKEKLLSKTWAAALLALICSALWGSAFSGVKVGYEKFGIQASAWQDQMVFAGIRFFIAGIMALIAGSIGEKKLLVPHKKSLYKIMIISLFQTVLQYFFYYIGLAHTTGVKAAIIVAANVFTSILISSLIFRLEKLTVKKIIGCIIGFAGIIVINAGGLKGNMSFSISGDGFIFLSTIANGFSSVLMKKYSVGENPVMLSGWQFCIGGLILWLISAVSGGKLGNITVSSVSILLYLAFVSAAAYSLWSILLKYNPVSKIAVFGFMNPVCGVIISGIVLKESDSFGINGLIALILVCTGIYVVNKNKKRK